MKKTFKRLIKKQEIDKKIRDLLKDPEAFEFRLTLAAHCFAGMLGEFEGSVVIHIQDGKAKKADVNQMYRFKK